MPKGNDYLSGWDHQLWDMVYHILFKFQVPVMFKDFQGSVPERRDTFLQWFVPEGSNYEAVDGRNTVLHDAQACLEMRGLNFTQSCLE